MTAREEEGRRRSLLPCFVLKKEKPSPVLFAFRSFFPSRPDSFNNKNSFVSASSPLSLFSPYLSTMSLFLSLSFYSRHLLFLLFRLFKSSTHTHTHTPTRMPLPNNGEVYSFLFLSVPLRKAAERNQRSQPKHTHTHHCGEKKTRRREPIGVNAYDRNAHAEERERGERERRQRRECIRREMSGTFDTHGDKCTANLSPEQQAPQPPTRGARFPKSNVRKDHTDTRQQIKIQKETKKGQKNQCRNTKHVRTDDPLFVLDAVSSAFRFFPLSLLPPR